MIQPGEHPKICAHRGLSQACPENTMPAFAAAISLGVSEIEFDLWLSRDGVPVVCHDSKLDRTTDLKGLVTEMNWGDIQRADAGIRTDELWAGVRVPRLEEVLDVFGHVGLNIHIKDPGPENSLVLMTCEAIRSRGLLDTAYIAGMADVLSVAQSIAPDIDRCCLAGQNAPDEQVNLAFEYGCKRLQFNRKVTQAAAEHAHAKGMITNLFWSDELDDARAYVDAGIDVVLTNRANVLLPLISSI